METVKKEITEKEIILAASGMDSFGRPKAMVSFCVVKQEKIDENNETIINETIIDKLDTFKPIINIFQNKMYIQIDLVYKSNIDKDLAAQWKFLQDYCIAENSENEKGWNDLLVFVYPNEYQYKYYIMGINPIFCLQSLASPNTDEIMIRMLFQYSNVEYLQADNLNF